MTEVHDHGREQHHPTPPSPIERRAAVLEELLTEKGLVPEGFIEEVNRLYENDIGPMNGAKVVARAWADPNYNARLLHDGTAAVAELGFGGPEGNLVAVANESACTTSWCARCAPAIRGQSSASRRRGTRTRRIGRAWCASRALLLKEMGCVVPDEVDIRVWDSSAEVRYLVVPERPAGTDGLPEQELAALVTRDSMIGVARL
jgi:nitrile hydratase